MQVAGGRLAKWTCSCLSKSCPSGLNYISYARANNFIVVAVLWLACTVCISLSTAAQTLSECSFSLLALSQKQLSLLS